MQRTLTLIRHAKSGWDDPSLDDHERTLTDRGTKAAVAMGQHLSGRGITFDLVLCSDATRTTQTSELLQEAMGSTAKTVFLPALYLAGPDQMLAQINRYDSQYIAVIGHNPGIAMLAAGLAMTPPEHRKFGSYPSCAVTHFIFDGPIKARRGQVAHFVVPADLKR